MIIDASAEGVLAEGQNEIARFRIGLKVFAHGGLSLYSMSPQDPILKVVTVEECKVLEVDKVVKFLERERVEVGVNGFKGECSWLSILPLNLY